MAMVTIRLFTPTRVIRKPLNRPISAPTTSMIRMTMGTGGGADGLAVDGDGDDGVHALGDEVVNLVGLGFGVEVGVGRDDRPAFSFCRPH